MPESPDGPENPVPEVPETPHAPTPDEEAETLAGPEEQDVVRRLLAATPPPDPMPPEVVARLDATLAALASGATPGGPVASTTTSATTAPTPPAGVSELEQRRRRRWPRLLVAAASVAVLGYGVGTVLVDGSPTAEMATSDSAGADAEAGAGGGAGGGADHGTGDGQQREGDEQAAPQPAEEPAGPTVLADGAVVELRSRELRRDVRRALPVDRGVGTLDTRRYDSYRRAEGACPLPVLGGGDLALPARLDGEPATLVLREESGDRRVAEVYSCDASPALLARTRVPARR